MRCEPCGQAFAPRRRDQRWCSAACRSRGYARARAEAIARHLAALDALRADLEAERARWAAAALRRPGEPPRRRIGATQSGRRVQTDATS
jgi:hypothetical protein